VNNAIIHGNKADSKKNVSLELVMNDDVLSFTVTDEGSGFDFENLIDPTAPENLEKIGGRGIFLMNHLCDEVKFEDEGKKVILEFNI
jgi:serine/threonine-protein kinase RsbW